MRGRLTAATIAALILLVAFVLEACEVPRVSPISARCDRIASPNGSDSAPGTQNRPFRSAQRLADSLAPGKVGCLRGGSYYDGVRLTRPGTTLRAFPRERARLFGRVYVTRTASRTTIAYLALNGANPARLPSPTIEADDVLLEGNNMTNGHTEICLVVNSPDGRVRGTVIRGNRIHDCGSLPATNMEHGIYVARADGTEIVGNLIYDNVDRGVQLYPDAQDTLVKGNIIDGNGVGVLFAGGDGKASSGNVVVGNVISNSRIRANVESFWSGGAKGSGNVVRGNCVSGGAGGNIDTSAGGFSAEQNLIAPPAYQDPGSKWYVLSSKSPCRLVVAVNEKGNLSPG